MENLLELLFCGNFRERNIEQFSVSNIFGKQEKSRHYKAGILKPV